jgi:hypothetical protein
MPIHVLGPNPLASTTQELCAGLNNTLFDHLIGRLALDVCLPTGTMHINDVAAAHILALDTLAVPPGSYVLQGDV